MSLWDVVVLMVVALALLAEVGHQVTRRSGLAELRVPADRRRAGRDRNGSVPR